MKHEYARKIMDKIFGIEEAISYLKIKPTYQQISSLSEIPFSEALLNETKETHILVAVFPFSLVDLLREHTALFLLEDRLFGWDTRDAFYNSIRKYSEVGWELVRKTPVKCSKWKTWDDQLKLLDKNDKVPTAQIIVYSIIAGHFLNNHLNLYVRTSSLDDCCNNHITVDYSRSTNSCGEKIICIGLRDKNSRDEVSLASAKTWLPHTT